MELFDPAAEPGKVAACYQMYAEGLPFDDPDGSPFAEKLFAHWMAEGFAREPREAALALDADGNPVGGYLLELPHRENTHIAPLHAMLLPGHRRRGYGTALLRHAAGRAAAHGRTLLSAEIKRDAPGSAFAAAMGARAGVLEVRRVLDVTAIPAGHLAALRRQAEPAAQGYSLLSWTGPTPEEYVDAVAQVNAALADAPRNPGEEVPRADPQEEADFGRRCVEMGLRRYVVAARCDRTGELAGLTQMGVDTANPAWCYQFTTAVAREHRGHRLGLLMKAVMTAQFVAGEPRVTRIITGNADSNRHMIAINAALGYQVLDKQQCWELEVTGSGRA